MKKKCLRKVFLVLLLGGMWSAKILMRHKVYDTIYLFHRYSSGKKRLSQDGLSLQDFIRSSLEKGIGYMFLYFDLTIVKFVVF